MRRKKEETEVERERESSGLRPMDELGKEKKD